MHANPMTLSSRACRDAEAMPLWRGLTAGAIPSLAAWVGILAVLRHLL